MQIPEILSVDLGRSRAIGGDGTELRLGGQVRALAEVAFEYVDEGTPVADLERLELRWSGERLRLSLGRMHTRLGYYNTAYHHGAWLELPISRPRAVAFEDEGGLLPVHLVGIEAGYRQPLGDA